MDYYQGVDDSEIIAVTWEEKEMPLLIFYSTVNTVVIQCILVVIPSSCLAVHFLVIVVATGAYLEFLALQPFRTPELFHFCRELLADAVVTFLHAPYPPEQGSLTYCYRLKIFP